MNFKLCRFTPRRGLLQGECAPPASPGLVLEEQNALLDLAPLGWPMLDHLLNQPDLLQRLEAASREDLPRHELGAVRLHAPVERQEIWAAGVTYLRSKAARMEESEFSATAYDRVYDADRPELFFKAMPEKVVGNGDGVGVRRDSKWSVPEPELALVLSPRGGIVGYTIGNDMSSRDIEGENLLYLPQAKIYERSCALGPWVVVGESESAARSWIIGVRIRRAGAEVFAGETEVARIKRGFEDLAKWLFRAQQFPNGAVLLTGTGVVPPDTFSLRAGDEVEINVSGIGKLTNPVVEV